MKIDDHERHPARAEHQADILGEQVL